jgi:hypothetical protein
MMGVQAASAQLFYDFCLDDHVPSDHMLRGIERHLELDELRQSLKPFYSQMGAVTPTWIGAARGLEAPLTSGRGGGSPRPERFVS